MRIRNILAVTGVLILGLWGCSENMPTSETSTAAGTPIRLDLDDPCGEATVVTLFAGQHIDVGTVTVVNDGDSLRVTIDTRGTGWVLTESHFGVALNLDDLPQTGSGNPQVGKFEYQDEYDPPVSLATYEISLTEYGYLPGEELFIAVHAVVQLLDEEGQVVQEETAWGDGLDFPGHSWATYFNYNVQPCEQSGITLLSPNDNGTFCTLFPTSILWTSENAGDAVMIELYLDGAPCSTIAASTPNDGEFSWVPTPCCGPEGCATFEYTIVITDLASGASDESNFTFAISGAFCGE
jgi:hypothetical protein